MTASQSFFLYCLHSPLVFGFCNLIFGTSVKVFKPFVILHIYIVIYTSPLLQLQYHCSSFSIWEWLSPLHLGLVLNCLAVWDGEQAVQSDMGMRQGVWIGALPELADVSSVSRVVSVAGFCI